MRPRLLGEAVATNTRMGCHLAICAPGTAGLFLRMRLCIRGLPRSPPGKDLATEDRAHCLFQLGHMLELTNYIMRSQQQDFSIYHYSLKLRNQIWQSQNSQWSNPLTPTQYKAMHLNLFNYSSLLQSVLMQRMKPGSIKNWVEYENLPQYYSLFIIHREGNSQNSLFLNWQKYLYSES